MEGEENKTGNLVQPIYIVVQKSSNKESLKKSYKSGAATIIGTIHMVCGLVAFGANISHLLLLNDRFNLGVFGTGIWSSVFFFISGGLSIGSGKTPNTCLVVSTMVMSIFSAISAGILVIFSGLGLGIDECSGYYHDCNEMALYGMHILQLLAGITEMLMAITSSILSCKATCCRDKLVTPSPYRVMYRPGGDLDQDQMVSLALKMGQTDGELQIAEEVACTISLLLAVLSSVLARPQGYAAEPYSYTYAVKDDYAKTNFGESASGAGDNAQGSYYVSLPDGRLQTVTYTVAGNGGYVAEVAYQK